MIADRKYQEASELLSNILEINHKNVIFTNSGTSALLCSLYACDVKDDEYIIGPNYGYFAWFNVSRFMKKNVLIADVNENSLCMSYDSVKKLVSKYKVKVIFYIYHIGILDTDILKIRELCNEKGIYLIEDSCNSLGSKLENFPIFSIGDVSTLSFSEKKTVDLGEGGAVIVNNTDLFEKITELQFQGNFHRGMKENLNLGLNLQMNLIAIERFISHYPKNTIEGFIQKRQMVFHKLISDFNIIHHPHQTAPSRFAIKCDTRKVLSKFKKLIKSPCDLTSDENYKTLCSFGFCSDCVKSYDILYLPNFNEMSDEFINVLKWCFK